MVVLNLLRSMLVMCLERVMCKYDVIHSNLDLNEETLI